MSKNTRQKIEDAKKNFIKNNDVKAFYNRIIQAATNTEPELFPSKIHEKDLSRYPTEDSYEDSLNDVVKFSEKITKKEKDSINTIIYHKSNSDGVVSAFIAWQYLTKDGTKEKDIDFIRLTPDRTFKGKVSPSIEKLLPRLKDKSVLMADLFYNKPTYEAIKNVTSFFVAIDDHDSHDDDLKNIDYRISVENKHATVAGVWKFFYPKERVPYFVQYVDSGDSSGHYKWLPEVNNFMTVMAVRFVKNQKKPDYHKNPVNMFRDMAEFFKKDITGLNFLVVIGQIMNEIRDNIKAEIAQTATRATFTLDGQSYPIMVMNFSAPGFTKMVLKNVAARNPETKFSVSWFYNYNSRMFDVSFATDHMNRPGSIDVGELAQKLGKKLGGSGGGHKNNGHITFRGKVDAFDKFIRT